MKRECLEAIRRLIWDRLEGNVWLYPPEEVDRAIRDAIGQINIATGFFRSSALIELLPGKRMYEWPNGMLQIFSVEVNGRGLARTTLRSIYLLEDDQEQPSGPMYWAAVPARCFVVHPAPPSSTSAKVSGLASAWAVMEDPDTVLTDKLVVEVAHLAAHLLLLKEGGRPFRDSMASYESLVSLMRTNISKRIPRFRVPPVEEEQQAERP